MPTRHLFIAAALLGILAAGPAMANEQKDLTDQVQAAMAAGNWQQAADALSKLVAIDKRWTNFEALGDVEYNLGEYQKASDAFDTAISGALDDKIMAREKLAAGLGTMFISKGHALEQLQRFDDAIAAYNNAARYLPDPAPVYFAVCAAQYNEGLTNDVVIASCDKAIAADPNNANAYFMKGSILVGRTTMDASGKNVAPPGTAEALQKYLDLAPNGEHAQDVRDLLSALPK